LIGPNVPRSALFGIGVEKVSENLINRGSFRLLGGQNTTVGANANYALLAGDKDATGDAGIQFGAGALMAKTGKKYSPQLVLAMPVTVGFVASTTLGVLDRFPTGFEANYGMFPVASKLWTGPIPISGMHLLPYRSLR